MGCAQPQLFSLEAAVPLRSRDRLPAGTTTISSTENMVGACLFDPKSHLSAFPAQSGSAGAATGPEAMEVQSYLLN